MLPNAILLRRRCAIAVSIEFAQLFGLTPNNGSFLAEIIFGSHFELWDFLAYGVGLAGAVAIDWLMAKKQINP